MRLFDNKIINRGRIYENERGYRGGSSHDDVTFQNNGNGNPGESIGDLDA